MQKERVFLNQVIQSLKLVASDANVQIQLLPKWVHIPDEIALTFEESYYLLYQIFDAGLVNSEQVNAINRVNETLSEMSASDDKSIWTLDALKNHPKWEKLRELSKTAITRLGLGVSEPDLGWISYIFGDNKKE
jgi:hypothetical protein